MCVWACGTGNELPHQATAQGERAPEPWPRPEPSPFTWFNLFLLMQRKEQQVLSPLFTSTDWFSAHITASTASIRLSFSLSIRPLLANRKTRRYWKSCTCGRTFFFTWSEHSTLFQLRAMASNLELLILIPAASHSVASCSSMHDEDRRTTLSAKSRHGILRSPNWTLPSVHAWKFCPYKLWIEPVTKSSPSEANSHRK